MAQIPRQRIINLNNTSHKRDENSHEKLFSKLKAKIHSGSDYRKRSITPISHRSEILDSLIFALFIVYCVLQLFTCGSTTRHNCFHKT